MALQIKVTRLLLKNREIYKVLALQDRFKTSDQQVFLTSLGRTPLNINKTTKEYTINYRHTTGDPKKYSRLTNHYTMAFCSIV